MSERLSLGAGLFLIGLLISFLLGGYLRYVIGNSSVINAVTPVEKTVRYQFRIQNTSNQVVVDSEVLIYAPAHIPMRQEVLELEANKDFNLIKAESGNQTMRFTLGLIPPYGSVQIVVSARIRFFEQSQVTDLDSYDQYLDEEEYVEINHPEISSIAQQWQTTRQHDIPRNLYLWIQNNIQDVGFTMANRGALYALEAKRGDCTEFMYLFSALARSHSIPTRNLGGFVLDDSGILFASSYHNWPEFYQQNSWRIADSKFRMFDQGYDSYLIMRILGLDEIQTDFSQSERFMAYDKRLRVRMN